MRAQSIMTVYVALFLFIPHADQRASVPIASMRCCDSVISAARESCATLSAESRENANSRRYARLDIHFESNHFARNWTRRDSSEQ
jgi:hypothetical protein